MIHSSPPSSKELYPEAASLEKKRRVSENEIILLAMNISLSNYPVSKSDLSILNQMLIFIFQNEKLLLMVVLV